MPMDRQRYPEDWEAIARRVKEAADWKCQKCSYQCLRPNDSTKHLTRSELARQMLTVHHQDYCPENNELTNLIALCSACHLSKHTCRRANISPGQLSLF